MNHLNLTVVLLRNIWTIYDLMYILCDVICEICNTLRKEYLKQQTYVYYQNNNTHSHSIFHRSYTEVTYRQNFLDLYSKNLMNLRDLHLWWNFHSRSHSNWALRWVVRYKHYIRQAVEYCETDCLLKDTDCICVNLLYENKLMLICYTLF